MFSLAGRLPLSISESLLEVLLTGDVKCALVNLGLKIVGNIFA